MRECPCGARGNWPGDWCPVCEADQWLRDREAKQDQREQEQQEQGNNHQTDEEPEYE